MCICVFDLERVTFVYADISISAPAYFNKANEDNLSAVMSV